MFLMEVCQQKLQTIALHGHRDGVSGVADIFGLIVLA